ncbi:hypothetical protein [Clostridium sp.]|uniref:TRADD-N-associated membrane domain-containing protein n=1 Tax=Clostridium sp. TaxID=1506 RepID=UPI003216FFDE
MIGLYNELADDAISIIIKGLSKKHRLRKKILIGSIISTSLILISMYLIGVIFNLDNIFIYVLIALLSTSSFFMYISIKSYLVGDNNSTVNSYLEELAKEREELNNKLKDNNNVMDVVRINLNQLNEYYTINKAQARRSYSFSVTMITIGFVVLILGITLWFYGKLELNITIIAGLAGLIAEFIGATALLLYKENSKQAQLFFDKLSYLQYIMLAIELSERLEDNKREEEISLIISSLIKK